MKAVPLFAVLLCACATSPRPVSDTALINSDQGGLTGRWKSSDGRLTFSTMMADQRGGMTFAAAQGCAVAQGVLRPAANVYRIELYPNQGFTTEGCPRIDHRPAALAPFNGSEVRLARQGSVLTASGHGSVRTLVRDKVADLIVRSEHLQGSWRLARAGRPLGPADGATLQFTTAGYRLQSACGWQTGDGHVTLPGLLVVLGGRFRLQSEMPCVPRTRGNALLSAERQWTWHYLPAFDRLEARSGSLRYKFVRG